MNTEHRSWPRERYRRRWVAGIGCLTLLVGCAPADPAGPVPDPFRFPIEEQLRSIYSDLDGGIRYLSESADLNGDGDAEVIVYAFGPLICGSGGCDLLVFTPAEGSFRLVGRTSVSRLPLYRATGESNGWSDLIVSVGGGGLAAGRTLLQFDGEGYPSNASTAPAVPEQVEAELLMEDFDSFDDGILLPPNR